MFSRHLHPTPLGFASGLFLVALWIAVWAGVFATVSLEARAQQRSPRPQTVAAAYLQAEA